MINYNSGLEHSSLGTKTTSADTMKSGAPDVIITERRDIKIQQLSFFADEQTALKRHLSKMGLSDIPHFSQIAKGKSLMAARVEMGKIWLISDNDIAMGTSFYPLDLSSSKNVIRLAGARAGDVMARVCAVDFRDKSRQFYATSLHHVGVHIHHHNQMFDLYMPRSFGHSLTDLLIDISRQYHVQMA